MSQQMGFFALESVFLKWHHSLLVFLLSSLALLVVPHKEPEGEQCPSLPQH